MEAASVAWEPLGWKPVAFSEIEPFPCAILKHRFPNTPNHGSLTEYQSWPVGPGTADLLVGGTPCQSFSVAGLRKGLEDPRGNLALVFLGLADKLKPRWIVWENVPGVLSSAGGRDFGSFLGALVELGYGFAYRVLDAQHFGVPQRRRRVFVVACLGDWRAPAEVLLEPDCVRRDIKKGRAKGQGVAAGAEGGVDANGLQRTVGTLCADTHPGAYSGQDAYTGRPIPDQKPVVIDRAAFNQGQNAQYEPHIAESEVMDSLVARGPHAVGQPIPFRKSKRACSTTDNETWVEAEASNTLNNFDLGDTRTTHAIVEGGCLTPGLPQRVRVHSIEAPCPTLSAEHGRGHGVPSIFDTRTTHAVVGPFAWTQNQREEVRILGDKTGALALPGTHQSNYIAEPQVYDNHPNDSRITGPLDVAPTVVSRFGTGGGNVPLVGAMAVRRLTPVECERLQGFPDNWSRISWKGKPEDQCPDGPRYKACGNSMAVPVMAFIGRRIAEVDAKYPCNKASA